MKLTDADQLKVWNWLQSDFRVNCDVCGLKPDGVGSLIYLGGEMPMVAITCRRDGLTMLVLPSKLGIDPGQYGPSSTTP